MAGTLLQGSLTREPEESDNSQQANQCQQLNASLQTQVGQPGQGSNCHLSPPEQLPSTKAKL
jgi:hypothetical protein